VRRRTIARFVDHREMKPLDHKVSAEKNATDLAIEQRDGPGSAVPSPVRHGHEGSEAGGLRQVL
jgi:hypothetical protein